jgi:hypothetical protein
MASTGNFYVSTKVVDGVATEVSLDKWANGSMSADEFSKFQAASVRQAAIFEAAIANGTVVVKPNVPAPGAAAEGITYVFNGVITDDPEWKTFAAQYANDPTLNRPDDHAVLTDI